MTPELSTPRLVLRPLAIGDAPAIQRRFPRWEIVRFMDAVIPWPYPADGATRFVDDELARIAAGRSWHWTIRRRAEPEDLIGAIGLRDTDRDDGDHRGFWLDPAFARRGFMTEACDAVTMFWFETLDRPVLRVAKAIENVASRRISEKQGMHVVRRFTKTYVSGARASERWELDRGTWRLRAQALQPPSTSRRTPLT